MSEHRDQPRQTPDPSTPDINPPATGPEEPNQRKRPPAMPEQGGGGGHSEPGYDEA